MMTEADSSFVIFLSLLKSKGTPTSCWVKLTLLMRYEPNWVTLTHQSYGALVDICSLGAPAYGVHVSVRLV